MSDHNEGEPRENDPLPPAGLQRRVRARVPPEAQLTMNPYLSGCGIRTSASAKAWKRWRSIAEKIRSGIVVVLDGGTGSEIEYVAGREALSPSGWTCFTNLTHPDSVREVHRSFLDAGADVLIVNTYCTNRHVLTATGKGDLTVEANLAGVRLAQEARDGYLLAAELAGNTAIRRPLIAGSISIHAPGDEKAKLIGKVPWPDPAQEIANYLEQATLLTHAGVDMIFLECVWNLEHGRRLLEAMKSIPESSALPIFFGLAQFNEAMYIEAEDFRIGNCLVMEERVPKPITEKAILVKDFVQEIASNPNVVGINVMHTHCDLITPVMKAVREGGWTRALGAYPLRGQWLRDSWKAEDIEDDFLLKYADEWHDNFGARLIGGCCGFRPDHIREFSRWADGKKRL
eukprot:TRINITY_DN69293_c0_g1_i1.p1 TRINITY_DN69293_c0_g1~~TRINITY_DN69293_c0_g1_i1.p1  ORF type:complete len:401 (+),score=53.02 TRINITY_DN69293_c0_g1_i1:65-1267(+)